MTEDSERNSSPLAYRSDRWKEIYRNRTSCERINNRILNDYRLHRMRTGGLAKNAFFCIIAGINIHMDAWIKSDMNLFPES